MSSMHQPYVVPWLENRSPSGLNAERIKIPCRLAFARSFVGGCGCGCGGACCCGSCRNSCIF